MGPKITRSNIIGIFPLYFTDLIIWKWNWTLIVFYINFITTKNVFVRGEIEKHFEMMCDSNLIIIEVVATPFNVRTRKMSSLKQNQANALGYARKTCLINQHVISDFSQLYQISFVCYRWCSSDRSRICEGS